jgi:hypothetical protein
VRLFDMGLACYRPTPLIALIAPRKLFLVPVESALLASRPKKLDEVRRAPPLLPCNASSLPPGWLGLAVPVPETREASRAGDCILTQCSCRAAPAALLAPPSTTLDRYDDSTRINLFPQQLYNFLHLLQRDENHEWSHSVTSPRGEWLSSGVRLWTGSGQNGLVACTSMSCESNKCVYTGSRP